jgi:hypothetical protein
MTMSSSTMMYRYPRNRGMMLTICFGTVRYWTPVRGSVTPTPTRSTCSCERVTFGPLEMRVERVSVIRVRCSLLMLTFVADEDEDGRLAWEDEAGGSRALRTQRCASCAST